METVYPLANALGRLVHRLLGYDIRIEGGHHVPRSGPAVIAATHVSFLDFTLVELAAVPRRRYVRFLTRHEVWHPRPLAWVMDGMGHVPVDRAAPAHAYLRSRGLLRRGEVVGIFPESGVSLSFTVRPLMPGAVALARETGAPVVPVAIWGPHRTLGPAVRDLRRGLPVDLVVGEPMVFGKGTDLTSGTRQLGARLQGQLDALQRLDRHRPRPGEYAPWYPAHLGGQAPGPVEALERSAVPRSSVPPPWGDESRMSDGG